MAIETQGRQLLTEYLSEPGRSQTSLARAIGFPEGQTAVSSWVRGIARPGGGYRKALALATGIHEDAWLTDEERQQVERARAAQAAAQPDPEGSGLHPAPESTSEASASATGTAE
jgi:hypothetical protein